jgi:hypothetical protein
MLQQEQMKKIAGGGGIETCCDVKEIIGALCIILRHLRVGGAYRGGLYPTGL